jgi:hypothetical protein
LTIKENGDLIKEPQKPSWIIALPSGAGREPEAELAVFEDMSVVRRREPPGGVVGPRLILGIIGRKIDADRDGCGYAAVGLQDDLAL